MSRKNPTYHTFTPSYEADSQADYAQKVREGSKRDFHVMVERGRTGARYGQSAEEQTPQTIARRKKRWDDEAPPWGARTQSAASHEASSLPPSYRGKELGLVTDSPELRVARAIQRYRETQTEGAFGLSVPDTPWPLIEAGMPEKEARILVKRAPRAFFPDVPSPDARQLLLAKTSLLTDIAKELRGLPFVRASEISVPGDDRRGLGRLVEVGIAGAGGQFEVVATDEDIKEQIDQYKESIGRSRPYRFSEDGPRFITMFFGEVQTKAEALRARWGIPSVVVELWFAGLDEPFEVPFSGGEHSKSGATPGSRAGVKYKKLQNVNLSDLPRLLVRLANRKKRKGRRLPPLSARTNPSMDSTMQQLDAFVLSEQEAGRLVPVPGKPGRVYWYSQRRKQLTETTETRARSWLAIAATGKASSTKLREAANQAYIEEGLDRGRSLPAPRPRQITTSQPLRENPMSYEDDYWFAQYSKSPYGARRSVPTARRNGRKGKANPQAKQAMHLYHSGQARSLKEAWAMVKGHHAAHNPWYPGTPSLYLPDTTQTRSAVVPAPYDNYQDLTQRYSSLVPGPYAMHNPQVEVAKNGQPFVRLPNGKCRFISKAEAAAMGVPHKAMKNPGKRARRRFKQSVAATKKHASTRGVFRKGPINYRRGQFSVTQTGGFQPVNRRNPAKTHAQMQAKAAMELYHSGRARSLKEAWAIVKGKKRR
jgi:hypothetical protein